MKTAGKVILCLVFGLLLKLFCIALAEPAVLKLPADLKIVETEAFYNSKAFINVVVPYGAERIESKAFANSSLTTLTLPETLTYIANDAFTGSKLNTVYAKDGSYAYSWAASHGFLVYSINPASDFEYTISGNECTITKYVGTATTVIIPKIIENCIVTRIEDNAFEYCNKLTDITIPDSVTTIGHYAFSNCNNLTSVSIPNGVNSIGMCAFSDCMSLTSISIPQSVTSIGLPTFSGCPNLNSIAVDTNNDYFSAYNNALYNKERTTLYCVPGGKTGSFVIPSGVTVIARAAISDCCSLTSITIPNSVTYIGDYAIFGCKLLTVITIPSSVTSIGQAAFAYCNGLTSIAIESDVERLAKNVFYGCNNLTEITIPNSVISIEEGAFWGCSSLTSITIPDSVTSIGASAFYNCYRLNTVVMPESVNEIASNAFRGCSIVKIIGVPGSYAEDYAGGNSITFTAFVLSNFKTDKNVFIAKDANTALFTVNGTKEAAISLYSSDSDVSCGLMHDDGINGDATANDGIYSLRVNVTKEAAGIVKYFASYGSLQSNKAKLTFYLDASEDIAQTTQDITSITEVLQSIDDAYSSGDVEGGMDAAEEYARDLIEQNLALSYDRVDDGVFVDTVYGLTIAYIPTLEGASLNGHDGMKLRCYYPCDDINEGEYNQEKHERTQNDITSEFNPDIVKIRESDVTFDSVTQIGPDSIVFWHGHGAYWNSQYGTYLQMSEKHAWLQLLIDRPEDLQEKRIIKNVFSYNLISGRYIAEYCGSMDNSIIFLQACSSGKDDKLAQAFLDKGATAVLGFTDTVSQGYDGALIENIINCMCSINKTTGNYYTLREALNMTTEEYGANDLIFWRTYGTTVPDWMDTSNPARPVIFGGANAENYRLSTVAPSITGKVTDAETGQELTDAAIKLYYKSDNKEQENFAVTWEGTTYVIKVATGTYNLVVTKDGYHRKTVEVNVTHGTTQKDIALIPESEETIITGHVTDSKTGNQLTGVTFSLFANDSDVPAEFQTQWTGSTYILKLQAAGTYNMVAMKEGYIDKSVSVTVSPGETVQKEIEMTPTISVGNYITFGHYEQDNDTSNGAEPIEWIVLAYDQEYATLLSKYELDFQRYNETNEAVTWETCSLRTWLNNDFMNDAFSEKEQNNLATVTVKAEKSPGFATDPGNDTHDRVYMLSYNEVLRYMPSSSQRQVKPSSYAKSLGAYTDGGWGQWWLRSPGYSSNRAIFIATHGGFYENTSYNYNDVTTKIGVRPVITVVFDRDG